MQVIVCLFTFVEVHGLHGRLDVEVRMLVVEYRRLLLFLALREQKLLLEQKVVVLVWGSGVALLVKLIKRGRLFLIVL